MRLSEPGDCSTTVPPRFHDVVGESLPRHLSQEFITGRPASDFVGAKLAKTELPGTTLSVDALIETPTRRLHIEVQTRANAAEFEPRLVESAARLNGVKERFQAEFV